MTTPHAGLKPIPQPDRTSAMTMLQLGRVVATYPQTNTVDVALYGGGILARVPVMRSALSRFFGESGILPATLGDATARATGANDYDVIVAYVRGNANMPMVLGTLPPNDSPLLQAPNGCMVVRTVDGRVTASYPDGAWLSQWRGGSITIGNPSDAPLGDALLPAVDDTPPITILASGVSIAIEDGELAIDAPNGISLNGDAPFSGNHADLTGLDFDSSGHVGFARAVHSHPEYALADHSHTNIGRLPTVANRDQLATQPTAYDMGFVSDENKLYVAQPNDSGIAEWRAIPWLQPSDVPLDTLVDDKQGPPPIKDLACSWQQPDPLPDLTITWGYPDPMPADTATVQIFLDTTTPCMITVPYPATSVGISYAQLLESGCSGVVNISVQTVDHWGNGSDLVSLGAEYPRITPTLPPTVATGIQSLLVSTPPMPRSINTVSIFADRDNQGVIGFNASNATIPLLTNERATVYYRWQNWYGIATGISPIETMTAPPNSIDANDLAWLEQTRVTSTDLSHEASMADLIDGDATANAITTTPGESITFSYPLARSILGIILYSESAVTPEWTLAYTDENGLIKSLGSNSDADHTVAGSENDWLLRRSDGINQTAYIAEALVSHGPVAYREWRFGDDAAAASRAPAGITARSLTITFYNAVALSQIRVLTYEAAQLLYARDLYLSGGARILNASSDTGFTIDSDAIRAYESGDPTVAINSLGKLWAILGGFGGTESSPYVNLTDQGLQAGPVAITNSGIEIEPEIAIYNPENAYAFTRLGETYAALGSFVDTVNDAHYTQLRQEPLSGLSPQVLQLENTPTHTQAALSIDGYYTPKIEVDHSANHSHVYVGHANGFADTPHLKIAMDSNVSSAELEATTINLKATTIQKNGVAVAFPVGDEAHGAGTIGTGSTNATTNPHTHAIDHSSAPGANAKILSTDVNGRVNPLLLSVGGNPLTVPSGGGGAALGAATVGVGTSNSATSANHTHAVDASSAPGANAKILATDANGRVSPLLISIGGNAFTVPTAGGAALGAANLSATTTNDATGANHTHAIIASSAPGVAASILKTTSGGGLTLAGPLEATRQRRATSFYPAVATLTEECVRSDYRAIMECTQVSPQIWRQNSVGLWDDTLPASPFNGMMIFRNGVHWRYDSSLVAWVAMGQSINPVIAAVFINEPATGYTTAQIGTSETVVWAATVDVRRYKIQFDEAYITTNVQTTNNGSNYWTVKLSYIPIGGSEVVLVNANTSADTVGTTYNKTTGGAIPSALQAINANGGVVQFRLTRTGSPGNLFSNPFASYKIAL